MQTKVDFAKDVYVPRTLAVTESMPLCDYEEYAHSDRLCSAGIALAQSLLETNVSMMTRDSLNHHVDDLCSRSRAAKTEDEAVLPLVAALDLCAKYEISLLFAGRAAMPNMRATLIDCCIDYHFDTIGVSQLQPERKQHSEIMLRVLFCFAMSFDAAHFDCREELASRLFDALAETRCTMQVARAKMLVDQHLDSPRVLFSYGKFLKSRRYTLRAIDYLAKALWLIEEHTRREPPFCNRIDIILCMHHAQLIENLEDDAEKSIVSIRDKVPSKYGEYLIFYKHDIAGAADWYDAIKSMDGLRELGHMCDSSFISAEAMLAYYDGHIALAAKVAMMATKDLKTKFPADLDGTRGQSLVELISAPDWFHWKPKFKLCNDREMCLLCMDKSATAENIPRMAQLPSNEYSMYGVGRIVERELPEHAEVAEWCYEIALEFSECRDDEKRLCIEKIKKPRKHKRTRSSGMLECPTRAKRMASLHLKKESDKDETMEEKIA